MSRDESNSARCHGNDGNIGPSDSRATYAHNMESFTSPEMGPCPECSPKHQAAADAIDRNLELQRKAFPQPVDADLNTVVLSAFDWVCAEERVRYARKLLPRSQDIEDVQQEFITKVFKSRANLYLLVSEKAENGSLRRLGGDIERLFMRNFQWVIFDHCRRSFGIAEHETSLTENQFGIQDSDVDPAQFAQANECRERAEHWITQLPKTSRTIIELRLIRQMSIESIAERLNMKAPTVRSRFYKLKKELSRYLVGNR